MFSYFLTRRWQRTGETLTYRDIWKRVSALVRGHAAQQVPQLEVSDIAEMDERFLGGAIPARSPYFTVSHDKDLGWVIDGGSVHGIPAVSRRMHHGPGDLPDVRQSRSDSRSHVLARPGPRDANAAEPEHGQHQPV